YKKGFCSRSNRYLRTPNLFHAVCMLHQEYTLPEKDSRRRSRIQLFFCLAVIFTALLLLFMGNVGYGDQVSPGVSFPRYVSILSFSAGCVGCGALIVITMKVKKQRDRTEKILSGNEERYRSIIASSNTGAWEYHADTKYQWCSPEYFTMLGYDEESLSKKDA